MNGIVVFDMDGTLCADGADRPLDGAVAAVHFLRARGFDCAVATNIGYWVEQVGERAAVDRVAHVTGQCGILPLRVCVCHHLASDECECRKPSPHLIVDLLRPHADGDPRFMVGDRWSDILAGQRAGCDTVLVGLDNWPYQQKGITPLPSAMEPPTYISRDIWGAARLIAGLASL